MMIMIIDLLKFVVYLSFTFLAGFVVLNFFPLTKIKPPFYIKLSWAYLLGVGAITWWMFVLSNFTSLNVLFIMAPWLVLAGYQWLKHMSEANLSWLIDELRVTVRSLWMLKTWNKLLVLLIFIQLVFVTYQALSRESLAFDALNNWIFKAKVFYLDKGIKPDFFNNEIRLANATLFDDEKKLHYLPDYPLLVPLNVTFLFMILGRLDLIMLKPIWILFYLILLMNFHFFVSLFSRKYALFYTFLLSTIPLFYEQVVGQYAPYADLILADYIFIGVTLFSLTFLKNDRYFLVSGLTFLSLSAWTKNEGLSPLILIAFIYIFLARRIKLTKWSYYLLLPVVVNLPYWLFKKIYQVTFSPRSWDNINSVGSFWQKLKFITVGYFEQVFSLANFNILWPILIVLVIFNLNKLFKPQILLPILFIIWQFVIVFLFHFLTTNDPVNILRLVFPYTPLALFIIANLSFKYLHPINFLE